MIQKIMERKNITVHDLSLMSGVPYSTVKNICSQKARIEQCTAKTIYRLAKALGVSMEELVEKQMHYRHSFDWFRSETCHRVKRLGDLDFLIEMLTGNEIEKYYEWEWYREAFYLLAMVDYLSRVNDVPLCNKYDWLRCRKLDRPIFPTGVLILAEVSEGKEYLEKAVKKAIPEFARYNIMEGEIRDVC